MARICMRSCHTFGIWLLYHLLNERVMARMRMGHGSRTNETCAINKLAKLMFCCFFTYSMHAYNWGMAHIWFNHATLLTSCCFINCSMKHLHKCTCYTHTNTQAQTQSVNTGSSFFCVKHLHETLCPKIRVISIRFSLVTPLPFNAVTCSPASLFFFEPQTFFLRISDCHKHKSGCPTRMLV